MDIFSLDKLYLAILFLIPGFVCMKIYAAYMSGPPVDASRSIVDALTWSCLIYAICSPAIVLIQTYQISETYPKSYAGFWFLLLFAVPTGFALAWAHIRKQPCFLKLLPHPTGKAWDYVFGQRESFYVIITTRSGKRIGGTYGGKSFTSSGNNEEQIFIEEVWDVDDAQGFMGKHVRSRGMLISNSQIESIEFIGLYDEKIADENDCNIEPSQG